MPLKHEFWLWLWCQIGITCYWGKRAYYLVTGPNPVANTYTQFIQRCWMPLIIRWIADSICFWVLFTPGLTDKALSAVGWVKYAWVIQLSTESAPVAWMFGFVVDSILDFAVNKIPFVKDVLPQMPGPIKLTTSTPVL